MTVITRQDPENFLQKELTVRRESVDFDRDRLTSTTELTAFYNDRLARDWGPSRFPGRTLTGTPAGGGEWKN